MGLLNTDLHYIMDREWWIRYLLLFGLENIKKTDDVLVNFRIHETSKTNTKAHSFLEENQNLYYSIAKMNHVEEAQILHHLFDVQYIPNLSSILEQQATLTQKAIHYFLLMNMRTAYAQNDFKTAKKISAFLNENNLQKEDIKELKKINQRIKYLPLFIKKLWNKHD